MSANLSKLPLRPSLLHIICGWLGSILAIGVIASIGSAAPATLVLGSFGASCVLVFGFPDLPFSQPRNVFIGHVLSSVVGVATLLVLGPGPFAMALATATAVAVMMALNCVHPPAGSNPIIIFLAYAGWEFVLFPTAIGATLLLVVALVFNNIGAGRRYPQYW
ncbi:HPP family protein [Alkalilimnicola ehrlichii]|uniref:HPP family protein n=1 Tax=Alkalilimnicola ehrlichii TaxID=351052 RepID=A0A3E0X277_9GAMM|nr:HPP family protein [Alkalilimnicola ehrlichii]RFA30977.1 HPP family protein [Alkalilimnicola ehrlichii]RFA38929.1 HPP family protein [Alkalilimnicola ehrlichii]